MSEWKESLDILWTVLDFPLIKLGKSSITIWTILMNLFFLIAFFLATAKLKSFILAALSQRKGLNISNWRAAITISYYAFLGIGLVGILQTTGFDLSFFTILTGAIGIGVGFGMQNILSNFISGIIILLEKPLKLGDLIEVGNITGNVQNISVRATTVITNDNISIIIPNSDFIAKQVINWSHSGNHVRIKTSVGVSYRSDARQVEKLLLEVAGHEAGVLKIPAPQVRLEGFGENSLMFSLLVWTEKYAETKGVLISHLNFGILKTFKEHHIQIPYPQRDLHIINDDILKQSLKPQEQNL